MIPLNVSGPFHTALLEPASQQLAQELAQITFDELQVPVISNTTAQPMQQDQIKELLTLQVKSPVRLRKHCDTEAAWHPTSHRDRTRKSIERFYEENRQRNTDCACRR